MSAPQANFAGTGGKKAVHVKWAGKTIALGTFPANEADEKCARAKALTRAWRSTMRPKPSREWVMMELERLGVRVVSGRLGRKAGEEDEPEKQVKPGTGGGATIDRSNSLGWASADQDLNSLMQRRSSSLGLSMIDSDIERRRSLGSLGQVVGLDGSDPSMPPHRPLVGGGAAAAYEAARADHYAQKNAEQQRRASSLGLGGIGAAGGNLGGASGGMPNMAFSVNPNQHYEMLKLHHMNLLNEIQETTLMMNLYQQQQLQQQQQQLQQQASAEQIGGPDSQMALLLQQQQNAASGSQSGIDSLYGSGGLGQQRSSLGLESQGDQNQQMEQLLRQQQINSANVQQEVLKRQNEQAALEERLQKLKEDIARRQKEAEELQAQSNEPQANSTSESGEKRKPDDDEENGAKRVKLDEMNASAGTTQKV